MRKLIIAAALCLCGTANAEYLGLKHGRTADMSAMPDLSVDAGFITGNIENSDYLGFGARVNYRLRPGLFLYGDLGMVDVEGGDGLALGFGAFYNVPDLLDNFDTAVKASFHTGDFDSADITAFSTEVVVSGFDSYIDSGLQWYANAGLHYFDGDRDNELEIGMGLGVVYPMADAEVFFGIDLIDELTVGMGYRYFIE